MDKLKIIWTNQSVLVLKDIYLFYKKKSKQAANNVKKDILNSPKTIYFAKQYQIDDINPKYRRIVVRDYKILYIEKNDSIYIMDIVCTKQSPNILQEK